MVRNGVDAIAILKEESIRQTKEDEVMIESTPALIVS